MALRRKRVSAPGCDDAPVVTVARGTQPRPVTFVYPFYENPRMLRQQIAHWQSYKAGLRAHLSVIVVDDGSPEPVSVALQGCRGSCLSAYRITVDVRWNWLAARNLGMDRAPEGWCLLTDMDHVVPEETLAAAVYGVLDPGTVYRFSRQEHSGERIAPHPNSWLMTRAMFWRIGGYDEALSGHYGTDGEYRRRVAATAPVRILTDALVRHEFVLDASTERYRRKQPVDAEVRRLVAARGPDWKPKVLSFPWTPVPL